MARLDMEPLCEAFEAPVPSPAGGSAAAAAAAIAASLVIMAGRGSPDWPEGAAAADAAAALRERLLVLGGEDVEAVAAVIAGSHARARTGDGDAFVQALVRAADVPLEIAGCAADVAELAARAGQSCRRPLRAEAAAAAALAAAATQIASSIVTGNLAAFPPGCPGEEIARLRDGAHRAAVRAGNPGALPQPPAVS